MKFTIETKVLASALKIASVAMVGGMQLPILGNIKIEAVNNQLILSTTNLDIYVIQKVAAEVASEGATTVAFRIFSQLVNRMDATTITISTQEKELLFKSGDVTATLETLNPEEFPPPLPQDRSGAVQIDAKYILKPFSVLAHAMHDDPSRYLLMGINLFPTKQGTDFAATNGHRLAIYHGAKITLENVIASDVFVRALLKIAPTGESTITVAGGVISFVSKEAEVMAKLVEGNFPNWRAAVPEKTDIAFSCDRKDLISALQTCAIFADNKVPALQLAGKKKEIEVSQPGKASAMVLGTELKGQPDISIRLNARYLIETLSVLESDTVRIQSKDGNSPVMIEEGPVVAVINRLLAVNP